MKAKKILTLFIVSILTLQSAVLAKETVDNNSRIKIQVSKQKNSPKKDAEKTFNLAPYWENYSDDLLNGYIYEALEKNLDIKIAQSRIKQSQAILGTVNAQRLPQLSVNPSIYPYKTISKFSGEYGSSNNLSFPLLLNWELDIFGKNLNKVQSSRISVKISQEQLNITKLAISSEVAASYFNIILTDELIKNNEEILTNLNETTKLKKQLYTGGIIQYDNLYLTEYEKVTKQNELNELYKQKEILLHQFSVLRGVSPEAETSLKRSQIAKLNLPFYPNVQISSDYVYNRPDVMQAELGIKKSAMDVRVAKKMFLPTVNLNEAVGFENLKSGRLFNWDSTVYQLGAGLLFDLYTGGAKMSNLRYNKAVATEKLHQYNNVLLNAICEIENELSSFKTDYNSYNEFNKTMKNSNHYYQVAQTRYINGVGNKIDELDARRQFLINENSMYRTKICALVDTVNIYKAFGSTFGSSIK